MRTARHTPLLLSAAALAVAALTGLAFAGWMENGAEILMTYAEAGLSWCF